MWRREELKETPRGGNEQVGRSFEESTEVLGGSGASAKKQLGYHFERRGREGFLVGGLVAGL